MDLGSRNAEARVLPRAGWYLSTISKGLVTLFSLRKMLLLVVSILQYDKVVEVPGKVGFSV